MRTHLTQSYVSSLKPDPGKALWITDDEIKNLKLYVGAGGSKVWYLYYYGSDGKKASKKLGAADKLTVAQARMLAQDVGGRVIRGENVKKEKPSPKLTYGEFLRAHYEPWVLANRKTGRETMQILRSTFEFLMPRPVAELSVMEIEQWRTMRIKEGRKAATLNRQITALKSTLSWALDREIIERKPLEKLGRLSEADSEKKVRYLSSDERERLFNALDEREERIRTGRDSHNQWSRERERSALPNLRAAYFADHLKPMIIVSLNTGIRQGSLFRLCWSDIDFQEGILTVRAVNSKNEKTVHIPMNGTLTRALKEWKEQTKGDGGKLVFPSPKSGEVMDNCKTAWARLLKDAAIPNFRWHDMRHDFASCLVMNGVDLNTVRELMGHADLKMTLRYAHLAPSVKMKAVETLDG
ncbi:MAG: site-specific integrase [Peptococcaceae bacterium]|jgi:integrase|nr:site-specific integrase [Peptococcaceae bacterium]